MFSNFDVFVLIVLLMSATLATYRGLVREVFSFISWVGAAVLTFMFYPVAAEWMRDTLKSSIVVSMIAIVVTYFSVFFLLSGISALLLDYTRDMRGGPIDRTAGLLFGVFRGLLIISLLHYCVVQVQGGPPPWLAKSEFFQLSSGGSKLVGIVIDEYVEASGERFGIKDRAADDARKDLEESIENEDSAAPDGEEIQQQMNHLGEQIKKSTYKQFTPDE